jgi:hypothetical protein
VCGSSHQKIVVQVGLHITLNPISKATNAKRAGGIAQVVEHLPTKHKALSSTPTSLEMKVTFAINNRHT